MATCNVRNVRAHSANSAISSIIIRTNYCGIDRHWQQESDSDTVGEQRAEDTNQKSAWPGRREAIGRTNNERKDRLITINGAHYDTRRCDNLLDRATHGWLWDCPL